MNSIIQYAEKQYELVQGSRSVLFDYCKTISGEDFLNENSSFGRGGSIRNLLVHIANTYEFWVGKHGLKKQVDFTSYEAITSIEDTVVLFDAIDDLVHQLIEQLDQPEQIEYILKDVKYRVEPLKLFTHVITHEFHHKGQILSLSRHLGYTPVDTDIMR